MRPKWFWVTAVVALIAWCGAIALQGLSDFDLSRHQQVDLTFEANGNALSGTLVLPKGVDEPPIVIIVHGDGPQDRFSGQGYLPLINSFADAGIGVFSWDKAGIGDSTGNWLDQSMTDRANETLAAYAMIQSQPDAASSRVGLLGFSQAGWVVPQVTAEVGPAFAILVGAAVSWQRQGDYYTSVRLRAEGLSDTDIADQIAAEQVRDDSFFAADHMPTEAALGQMSVERFGFVRRNRFVDATETIAQMRGPVLALWGADDLNVDPIANAEDYRKLLPEPARQRVRVIPDATHGLLRAAPYNMQLTSDWPMYIRWAFVAMGRRAYAPDTLSQITTWVKDVAP